MKLKAVGVGFGEHSVIIPTQLMGCMAGTGILAGLSYGISRSMKSKPMTMFLTANVIVLAGQTAYQLYAFNRDFAKMEAEYEKNGSLGLRK